MMDILRTGVMAASVAVAAPVFAAGFDTTMPLLCASTTVIECVDGSECQTVPARAINAPEFLKVEFDKNLISTLKAGAQERSTPIERMEVIDRKIMLQGAEEALENIRDGLAWSLVIAQDTGRMSLAAASDETGFVIFGVCTPFGQ
jgi:hypothetical protein